MMNIETYFVLHSQHILKSPTYHILVLRLQQFFIHFIDLFLHFVDLLVSSAIFFQLSSTLLSHLLFFELKDLLDFIQVLKFDFDCELVTVLVGCEYGCDDLRFCFTEGSDNCFVADTFELFVRRVDVAFGVVFEVDAELCDVGFTVPIWGYEMLRQNW